MAGVLLVTPDGSLGSFWRTRAILRAPWGGLWACAGVSWETRWASLLRDWRSLGVPRDVLVDFSICSEPSVSVMVSLLHGGSPPLGNFLGALQGPFGHLVDLSGAVRALHRQPTDVIRRRGATPGTALRGMDVLGPLRWTSRQPCGAISFANVLKYNKNQWFFECFCSVPWSCSEVPEVWR